MSEEIQIFQKGTITKDWKDVVTLWMQTGRLVDVQEKLSQIKGRQIAHETTVRFLKIPSVQEEIRRQWLSNGYDKIEMETDLIKDIKGIKALGDGQRQSIAILAKVRRYMEEGTYGVNLNQKIEIVQGNGER